MDAFPLIDNALHDMQFALRVLRKNRGFTAVAILTLALGIGLSTAVFTVADALLIRRLPVHDQNRIVVLSGAGRARTDWPIRLDEAREFALRTRSLSEVAFVSYYGAIDTPIRDGDHVSRLRGSLVSGNYFDVIGAKPALGRALRASDDVVGAAPVVVLSYAAWQRRFDGDPGVVGRRVVTYGDGTTYTVVGVMPQGLDYPKSTDFWAPVVALWGGRMRSLIALHVVGRLKPGATPASARDDFTAFLGRADAPSTDRDFHGFVHTLPQLVLGDTRPAVLAFAAAAALLLLITCINVANLHLMRGLSRAREIAVRSALGGSRRRVVAQLLTESAVLAFAGGALGVGVAALAVRAFVAIAPSGMPRLDEIGLNPTVLAGAVAITVLSLLVFALTPAITTSRVELQSVLRSDTRQSGSRRSRRLSESLVTAQVALALVVLSSAGLIARSLMKLERANLSFNPSHLLIGELSVRVDSLEAASNPTVMLDRLLPRLQAIPGVLSVSPVVAIPFSGSHGWDGVARAEGQSAADAAGNPMLNMEIAAPGYFATFGIPILRGRAIADADRKDAPPVVVLSQSAARHFWPHDDPIGKRVLMGSSGDDTATVVGVVPDTRYRDLRDARPSIYFPLSQSQFPTPMTLAIRTIGPPAALVSGIRRVIGAAEPGVALVSAAPFDSFLAAPLAQPRLNALLLAVFACAAVVLAAIGLFGVMATMVRQRTREFGIRMALGADRRDLMRMVVRRGVMIAAPGIAVGIAGALFANRLLSSLLYEVNATDLPTLAAVGALLLLVASGASFAPARSSTRVNPTDALRAE